MLRSLRLHRLEKSCMQCRLIAALCRGLTEVGAFLNGKDSGADSSAARVDTPAAPLSVLLAAPRCRYILVGLTSY